MWPLLPYSSFQHGISVFTNNRLLDVLLAAAWEKEDTSLPELIRLAWQGHNGKGQSIEVRSCCCHRCSSFSSLAKSRFDHRMRTAQPFLAPGTNQHGRGEEPHTAWHGLKPLKSAQQPMTSLWHSGHISCPLYGISTAHLTQKNGASFQTYVATCRRAFCWRSVLAICLET